MNSRPKTLAEVAARTLDGAEFRMELADFLDEFYIEPNSSALAEPPVRLSGKVERGQHRDVYLAAVAEHLGREFQLEVGAWAFADDLFLEKPSFAYASRGGRIFLLRDSPPAFKSRNLFVTANVLTRV